MFASIDRNQVFYYHTEQTRNLARRRLEGIIDSKEASQRERLSDDALLMPSSEETNPMTQAGLRGKIPSRYNYATPMTNTSKRYCMNERMTALFVSMYF
jgi:hypothetical protein